MHSRDPKEAFWIQPRFDFWLATRVYVRLITTRSDPVRAAYSEARIKSNYLVACHRTKFKKILCLQPAGPLPHAAKVRYIHIYTYIPDMLVFNSRMRRKVRLRRDQFSEKMWESEKSVFFFKFLMKVSLRSELVLILPFLMNFYDMTSFKNLFKFIFQTI